MIGEFHLTGGGRSRPCPAARPEREPPLAGSAGEVALGERGVSRRLSPGQIDSHDDDNSPYLWRMRDFLKISTMHPVGAPGFAAGPWQFDRSGTLESASPGSAQFNKIRNQKADDSRKDEFTHDEDTLVVKVEEMRAHKLEAEIDELEEEGLEEGEAPAEGEEAPAAEEAAE